ncbi:MAG: FAD-dependent monooxygenase [Alphaproteobacteria bacterium]|nr:FAD-dependent monooxygenase [Alphaproteobacteria bacterium]
MKVIISGAGIGGLTAALCLLHNGIDATVLERAPELGEIGAGIQVPPNAMKVFEALGLDGALAEIGFRPEAIEARMGRSGLSLFNIPLADAAVTRWGAPYLHIHRADYIAVLEAALLAQKPDAIRFGADVAGYTQDADAVRVQLTGGTELVADALVGGDGIHSTVREVMLGSEQPSFTGNVAWRAVVSMNKLGALAPHPTACAWMGAGKHCVTYRLRRGTLANFVGVVERDDWTTESWTERGTAQQALADFADWHPTITRILSEASELYRWALFDRQPLKSWVDGRVALLGDAAHPMLPFMAQGAAMAVEDAFVLAHQLASEQSVSNALQSYQQARFARTAKVQAGSRANAKTFHKRTRLSQLATYGPMWLAGKIAPTAIHARQDALYGHDVTA